MPNINSAGENNMILTVVKSTKHRETIKQMSKVLFVVTLCLAAVACGGQSRMPIGDPTPRPSPTPIATPTPQVTITAASVFNMGMIGQTWTYINGNGAINTFEIQAVPDGTACRSGNNLAIHMTKTTANTYWQLGAAQAEIWFVLHQNDDGSWRSTASLINMPLGSLFSGPMVLSSDVIDNQPGMPRPYMIAPLDTATGQHFIYETRSSATGVSGLSYTCNVPDGTPLTGPSDGEYWRTDFYIESVSTPMYTGPAIVSDQFEGVCGHEKWYFAPNLGIVEIQSLNDGGEIKNNSSVCNQYTQHQFDSPTYYIKRIS
jgi:hypothetical protein